MKLINFLSLHALSYVILTINVTDPHKRQNLPGVTHPARSLLIL